ncbi:hypothetical protein [Cytophaga hutchinsonii]|uniref:Outer membrane protein beta-barrel domain-containing protein n=1 Tax=Cytophaga hutchinsonii (strain ATCC 33406 / DSM 1761 / CIP 103989 / NBRC 15051 / NCIMB 9469 / D465) TaxID=269798 RepID=A0A6N4SPE2_CYTH3|nr:hypothetical protein [Cytophaga hutchinsonii]ABG58191.1 conserved hypothetical protein; possible exonuclease V beta subunit [Cytophaga hutchinsonii ATCC 33406]SFX55590.1 hypothetical protein SAMN04487930_105245 [Cytophaga hutchinsonii ATCC 33406]
MKSLLTIVFGLGFLAAFAQDDTLIIDYDFGNNTIGSNKSKKTYWVKEKYGIEFRIRNINLFNYNITINNSKEDYLNNTNTASPENQYNNLFTIESINTDFVTEVSQVNILQGRLDLIIEKFYLQDNIRTSFSKKIFQKQEPIYVEWLHQAVLYYKNLSVLLQTEEDMHALISKRDSITTVFYRNALENNNNAFRSVIAYNQVTSIRQRVIEAISNKISYTQQLINEINFVESSLLESTDKAKAKVFALNKNQFDLLKTIVIDLQNEYRKILQTLSSDKIDIFASNIQKAYMSFEKSNYEVHIKEYDLRNIDVVKLDVTIEPKNNALGYKSRKEKFSSIIRTYGGLRFDVSAGLMFNMNLNDRSYYYDSSGFASDTSIIVRAKNRNSYIPFVGTQLNVYANKPWRAPFSPGVCIGVSTDLKDLRYYLGGCMVIGNQDRIVFSGGLAGGQVNILSGNYDTNKAYLTSSLPDAPVTEEAFRLGYFFSITYNLTSNNTKAFGEQFSKTK